MIDKNLAETIDSIMEAMKSDYGEKINFLFTDDTGESDYKNSLYKKLKGIGKEIIFEAYDLHVEREPERPPKVVDLVRLTIDTMKKEPEKAALPPPSAKSYSVFQMLRDAIEAAGDKTERAAWMIRKAKAWEDHQALLKKHESKIAKGKFTKQSETEKIVNHDCSVTFCGKTGTVSGGFGEGINYYCKEHFRNYG